MGTLGRCHGAALGVACVLCHIEQRRKFHVACCKLQHHQVHRWQRELTHMREVVLERHALA